MPSSARTIVAKIGTSSLTDDEGIIQSAAIFKLSTEVAELRSLGHRVVVVTSGAIAAGLPELGLSGIERPSDSITLQAVSAVGQLNLMRVYKEAFSEQGIVIGQALLAPLDFTIRSQYLHARSTLSRLLELAVVPIINENDAIADDEIRFGDNDRIAALVAHLVGADDLVLLTDMPGVLTADPRLDPSASLIEEIVEFDQQLEAAAGASGTVRGSGGMASKIAAAKIASWSGVRTVIADAERPDVLIDAIASGSGVGTVVVPRSKQLGARKLWIAFAVGSKGRIEVDQGAAEALRSSGRSLLAAGVTAVAGVFEIGDAAEIAGPDGVVFAKGLVRQSSADVTRNAGKRSKELGDGVSTAVVHRDDLVMLP
ncbi:MAG: glutamate 5-kinase [Acidimicrobiales bacterium]